MVLTVFVAGLGYLVWCFASVPRALHDCYGQWDAAELIIRFHRQHNRLPASWEQIGEVYGDGSGLHGGMTFMQLKETIVMEFARLGELQELARQTSAVSALPEIVYPRSGRQSHWAGAEPNHLVYDYLRTQRERP